MMDTVYLLSMSCDFFYVIRYMMDTVYLLSMLCDSFML